VEDEREIETRIERWERRSEVPLVLVAGAFLVAYAWPILDPRLDHDVQTVLSLVTWTAWIAFAIDLGIRLWLAEERLAYARRHWYDVALVALPVLRPLRLLRLLALARVLDRTARSRSSRALTYIGGVAVMGICLGSLAVLQAERGAPGATITSFGDALWWAMETVTTVGYGDMYPVTTTGRVIAVALMLVGIAVIGVITASIAAWLMEGVRPHVDE
jgi:voltage-gated potassium channel